MSILYIGNKLAKHGFTPTSVEYLGDQLKTEYRILQVSDKKNWGLRLWDSLRSIFINRKELKCVLIDTYSTWNFYGAWVCAFLARMLNIPYVPILHGGNLPLRFKQNPHLANILFGGSAKIVSPSHYLKAFFEDKGYQVQYIPNFVHVAQYVFQNRQQIKPKLLWVRAFDQIYHPEMAIEVLSKLKAGFPDAHLCMIGPDKDGSMGEVEAKAKELGFFDDLELPGKLSKKEWIEKSREYDVFLNTTNFDNQPVSIIEAMALGFPIVSTNAGGLPYLIDHEEAGLLVNKNDSEAMANQIEGLIQNPELAHKLSVNARKKAEEFDWAHVKPQWDALLKKFVN
jgi:glycosyltransferase involved in cell wall biosynthesis